MGETSGSAVVRALGRAARWTGRWLARGLVLAAFAVLALGVLVRHQAAVLVGSPSEASGQLGVASDRAAGSAVVSIGQEIGRGIDPPPGTVALTFDDGPDPVFTRQILAVLADNDVRATFFVIGKQVLDHPSTARAIVSQGHELGNHSHLHYEMGQLSARQVKTQLDLAQLALVETTGTTSSLYRAPYSVSLDNLSEQELVAAETAQRHGYYVIGIGISPRDYDPAVTADQLLLDSVPRAGAGAVITLHDGGGDRSATVSMLGPLIAQLRAAGYEFVTIGDLVTRATGVSPVQPASNWVQLQAKVITMTLAVTGWIEKIAIGVAIAYMVLYVTRMGLLISVGLVSRKRSPEADLEPTTEMVSVIVPAYNEEVGIADALRSIDSNCYPNLEIIVVDDGSTDATADIARSLGIDRVRVLTIENGGKPGALNHGVRQAKGNIVVMVDGDTLLEPDSVSRIVQPFADPQVGAVAGNPKIGNANSLITRLQVSEYLVASSLERRLLRGVGMITTIPGAIGAWRRSALQEVGYVSAQTLAEDTDLTVAIARGGWKIGYVPDARAWTEAPSTWRSFYRQRMRWTFGTLQVLWKHRRGYRDRGDGSQIGRVALPYMFVSGYLLSALGPIVDLVLLANLSLGSWRLALTSWAIIAALGVAAGTVAARLDGDRTRPALLIPLQQLVYRPIMHMIALASLRRAALGTRQAWGTQQRVGGLSTGAVAA